jgi:hypothetical protein
MYDSEQKEAEPDMIRQMRRVAFTAVVFSTVAAFAAIVTLPSLYSYIQHVNSQLDNEMNFCKARADQMYTELSTLNAGKAAHHEAQKRQASSGSGCKQNELSFCTAEGNLMKDFVTFRLHLPTGCLRPSRTTRRARCRRR